MISPDLKTGAISPWIWITPWLSIIRGTPRCANVCRPSWWRDSPSWSNNSPKRVKRWEILILTMKLGLLKPFTLGLIVPNVSTMRKWSGHGRGQLDTISGLPIVQAFVRFGQASSIRLDQDADQPARNAVREAMVEKYAGPIVYKGEFNEELFCIGCGAPFRQKTVSEAAHETETTLAAIVTVGDI